MKKTTLRRLLAPALALCLLLSGCASGRQKPAETPQATRAPVVLRPAEAARDTAFFTPQPHTQLNYDEIAYEPVDGAPLLEEIAALRALMADAENAPEFEPRLLALADSFERAVAMYYLLENRVCADASDDAAAREYQRVYAELLPAEDAFNGLVRDALRSPCAPVLQKRMSPDVQESFLDYTDKSDEEIALEERVKALENEYRAKIVEPAAAQVNGTQYTQESAWQAYFRGDLSRSEYVRVSVELTKAKNAALVPLFLELVDVRGRIARLEGYDGFAAYAYADIYGRDYTPDEAQEFCEAVKACIVPVSRACADAEPEVDPRRIPAATVYSGSGMFETLFPYFAQISDELLESARYLYEHRAFDVDPAPNKTSTAYSQYLPYYGMPFYFNNAGGGYTDLITTIHELGHSNEAYWNGAGWCDAVLCFDTAEVHSQGLEVLMFRFYPELFGPEADAIERSQLRSLLSSVVDGCLFDEFLRWAYAEPELTAEKLNAKYRALCGEYGYVDADDPRTEMYGWYEIPHNFLYPMYYISYAASAVGAFLFWERSCEDYFAAADDYLRFTAQPHSLGFSEAFRAVGLESPMSESSLRALASAVRDRLLDDAAYDDAA